MGRPVLHLVLLAACHVMSSRGCALCERYTGISAVLRCGASVKHPMRALSGLVNAMRLIDALVTSEGTC